MYNIYYIIQKCGALFGTFNFKIKLILIIYQDYHLLIVINHIIAFFNIVWK